MQELFVHQRGILPSVTRNSRDSGLIKVVSLRTHLSAKSRSFLHQAEVRIFVLAKAALNPLARLKPDSEGENAPCSRVHSIEGSFGSVLHSLQTEHII